ncbi:MAG: hypothetical protein IJH71_09070 [Eubacterium sp.]|nr:hypothetical protein [Eubacterium sp.]
MAKQKTPIDVTQFPAGLTKKEFVMLPELKKYKSWFTWAGIVGIVSGILGFASFGQVAELEAQGYQVNMGFYGLFAILSVAELVFGILLLVKKDTKIAYVLGVLGLVTAVLALASGGRIGAGVIATVLAIFGAHNIDNLWKEYQSNQGNII